MNLQSIKSELLLSDDEIKAANLFTAFENLKKGFKDSELGKGSLKRVEKMARELVRAGLIIPKPTGYGLQVSLNPKQNQTIIAIMKRHFPED
jgi:hypothetical protein